MTYLQIADAGAYLFNTCDCAHSAWAAKNYSSVLFFDTQKGLCIYTCLANVTIKSKQDQTSQPVILLPANNLELVTGPGGAAGMPRASSQPTKRCHWQNQSRSTAYLQTNMVTMPVRLSIPYLCSSMVCIHMYILSYNIFNNNMSIPYTVCSNF